MALTRLIGDIHGAVYDYKCLATIPSIQIGDFGIGFGQSDAWHKNINEFQQAGNHRFIRGNHDNPERCKAMQCYIADGTIENDIAFIGGAWSIDNPNAPPGWYRRTPNVDWWADEECSEQQFERMFDVYCIARPRIMITHDCPESISYKMFWDSGFIKGSQYPNRTSTAFNRFYAAHQPQFWFFGHWHKSMMYKRGATTFVCIGELDYIDADFSDSDKMHEAIFKKFSL